MNHQSNSSKDTPFLPSKSILKGRWVTMEKIGNGGFGEIYKAKDLETKKVSVCSCVEYAKSVENSIDNHELSSWY